LAARRPGIAHAVITAANNARIATMKVAAS
jgi:hypothetical protein